MRISNRYAKAGAPTTQSGVALAEPHSTGKARRLRWSVAHDPCGLDFTTARGLASGNGNARRREFRFASWAEAPLQVNVRPCFAPRSA